MTDKELWKQMENLSNEEPSIERNAIHVFA